jgi:CubicO group peptidase (beta-lactamase class C family)
MQEHRIPGIALGVSDGDQLYTAGLGITNVDHPLDVTDETLFQIGSVTKTFTTTAIMRLVEMGKLALNAPVRQYLPDFRVADEAVSALVTVRHLVTHSAGWEGDVFTNTGLNDDALKIYVDQMAAIEQLAPPDLIYSYNNAAFAVAGLLIETATGKPFETAVRELVFQPLGLDRAFFFAHEIITQRFAVGHVPIDGVVKIQRPWALPRASNPAGGIICDVRTLLRYARFHMGDGTAEDGTRVLTSESMRLMQTPQFHADRDEGDVGLSWMIRRLGDVTLIQHGGATMGQVCSLVISPAHRFAVAILTNSEYGGLATAAGVKVALKAFLDAEETLPAHIEADPDQLAVYTGTYKRPSLTVNTAVEDGRLTLHIEMNLDLGEEKEALPPPIPTAMCGPDQFIVTDGVYKDARVEFLRDASGSIGWMRIGGRINPRVTTA